MKKFLITLMVFTFGMTASVNAHNAMLAKTISQTIRITSRFPPQPRPRTAIEPVAAAVNAEMGQIEVAFNEPIGKVSVYIINSMGEAVSRYSCNTASEWFICLPIPTVEGLYTIEIVSDDAEYFGYFNN